MKQPFSYNLAADSKPQEAMAYLISLAGSELEYHLDDTPVEVFAGNEHASKLAANTTHARAILGEDVTWSTYMAAMVAFDKSEVSDGE